MRECGPKRPMIIISRDARNPRCINQVDADDYQRLGATKLYKIVTRALSAKKWEIIKAVSSESIWPLTNYVLFRGVEEEGVEMMSSYWQWEDANHWWEFVALFTYEFAQLAPQFSLLGKCNETNDMSIELFCLQKLMKLFQNSTLDKLFLSVPRYFPHCVKLFLHHFIYYLICDILIKSHWHRCAQNKTSQVIVRLFIGWRGEGGFQIHETDHEVWAGLFECCSHKLRTMLLLYCIDTAAQAESLSWGGLR